MDGMLAREEASENFPAAPSEFCFLKIMLSRSLWITASGIKEGWKRDAECSINEIPLEVIL